MQKAEGIPFYLRGSRLLAFANAFSFLLASRLPPPDVGPPHLAWELDHLAGEFAARLGLAEGRRHGGDREHAAAGRPERSIGVARAGVEDRDAGGELGWDRDRRALLGGVG